jgi:hypothetical protein
MWHSSHPDCLPVALCTPSQNRNVSLSHLPTTADSVEFCMETTMRRHYTFCTQCWSRPQSAGLNVAQLLCTSCCCLACCTDNFFRRNRWATFTSLHMFIAHIWCFFELFRNQLCVASRWCNKNRKFSTIFRTPCSPLRVNRRFGGICRLHLQGQRMGQARNQKK